MVVAGAAGTFPFGFCATSPAAPDFVRTITVDRRVATPGSFAKNNRIWRWIVAIQCPWEDLNEMLILVARSVGPRPFASCLWRCQPRN